GQLRPDDLVPPAEHGAGLRLQPPALLVDQPADRGVQRLRVLPPQPRPGRRDRSPARPRPGGRGYGSHRSPDLRDTVGRTRAWPSRPGHVQAGQARDTRPPATSNLAPDSCAGTSAVTAAVTST